MIIDLTYDSKEWPPGEIREYAPISGGCCFCVGTDQPCRFGIPVVIEVDEDAIVVTDYIIHMYGVGNTVQEAIEDYKISIKAYREELLEDEDRLSSYLKQHLYYLRKFKAEPVTQDEGRHDDTHEPG